jgi:putative endonuclease
MSKDYQFYVYILTNNKKSTFYIGFTNNIIRRLIEHQQGLGSEFTKTYQLKQLVYYEHYQYVYEAINREKELKGWLRRKKIALIKETNPTLKDLGKELFRELGIADNEIKEIAEELKRRYKQ